MTDQTPGPVHRAGLRQKLQNRYRRFHGLQPRIAWKRWLLLTLLLIAFAALVLDRPVTVWVRTEPSWLRSLAAAITDAGKSGWILISTAVIGLLSWFGMGRFSLRAARLRAILLVQSCLYIFISVAGSGLLSNLVKRAVGRARPMHLDDMGLFSFHHFASDYDFESFPSGHSTTDGALAMSLALLFPPLRVPIMAVGLFLAVTRTLVGAHYPSDVVTGFSFGVWFALATAIVMARYGLLFRSGVPGLPRR